MINHSSISLVDQSQFTAQFKRPLYHSYAYSLIPNTIMRLLTGEKLETLSVDAVGGKWKQQDVVILFLVDGFGWSFFDANCSAFPFLSRYEKQGVASKISSQFPSTTSAHISTICTGLEVGQTGIYEWFQYEPLVERMIAPLLFSFAGDHQVNTLAKHPLKPSELFPFTTFYQDLKKRNVESFVVQQESIIHSPYSQAMFKGCHPISFKGFKEALNKVVDLCQTEHPQPVYIFVYFGDIDAAGHRHGIGSKEFNDAIGHCFTSLEEHFYKPLSSCKQRIASIVTADHGMAPVNPRTTVYVNKEFPRIQEDLKKNQQGKLLVPAGSCRDFFLHIKEEKLIEVQSYLSEGLKGKAEVLFVQDLIDQGFFGSLPVSRRFLDRVGNLVILPHFNESVWWYEKHHFEQNFYAAHGGLTPQEIESIFLYQEMP